MTRVRRRRVLQLAGSSAVATLAGLAGCLEGDGSADGSGDGNATAEELTPGDGELGDPDPLVEVDVVWLPSPAFEPGLVHVEPGGAVRWVVEGHRHDVTAYHPETYGPLRMPDDVEPWESDLLREGREFEHTFQEAGIYDYADTRALCGTHESLGAVGRVVVGWPDIEDEPAIAHDADSLPGRAGTVMNEYDERTRTVLESE
ncbi:cupredoxin domain-containing protein [Halobiforma nitratireducens]|uniref:Halocyanin-like protein (Copper-containing protein) 2 n=1 Tax=Halobiforma nitratireducens JCM 10879 TaxID=1227454 RepID=M0LWI9_9EURY|nr:hypothetical protein [Halobiforma nitratireducens]EMA37841.1 halocyanin-like protein (copper-containing protein) 2 [Halobiforma nitratireducens JCM 10879]